MSGEYKLSKAQQARQAALQARADAQTYMSDGTPKSTDGMMGDPIPRGSVAKVDKSGKFTGFYHASQTEGRSSKILTTVGRLIEQMTAAFKSKRHKSDLSLLRLGSGYKLDDAMRKIALDEPDIHKRVLAIKTEIELRGYSLGDKAIRALLRKNDLYP